MRYRWYGKKGTEQPTHGEDGEFICETSEPSVTADQRFLGFDLIWVVGVGAEKLIPHAEGEVGYLDDLSDDGAYKNNIYRNTLSPPSPAGEEIGATLEWLRTYLENLDDYPEPREAIERIDSAIRALKRQSGEG